MSTSEALEIRDSIDTFLIKNGWEWVTSTVPGTAKVKILYKSPITGNYHSLSFALGQVLENHGIAAT